jgi:hypothetical protein
MAALP